jgi:hypothetical protein
MDLPFEPPSLAPGLLSFPRRFLNMLNLNRRQSGFDAALELAALLSPKAFPVPLIAFVEDLGLGNPPPGGCSPRVALKRLIVALRNRGIEVCRDGYKRDSERLYCSPKTWPRCRRLAMEYVERMQA